MILRGFKCTNIPGKGDVPQIVLLVGYDLWLHLKSAKRNSLSYEILEIFCHFKILPLKQKIKASITDILPPCFLYQFHNGNKIQSSQFDIALLLTFQTFTFLRNGYYNHHWCI